MANQPTLFDNAERYEAFGELPEDYPKGAFEPYHPAFDTSGYVTSGQRFKRRYFVDLSIGECTCPMGHAWAWGDIATKRDPDGKWYLRSYCTHKLRMMASIVDGLSGVKRAPAEAAYVKALATRYNKWNVVSAFHKELRRGDFNKAWFWGLMLSAHRGMDGVIKYLLNIIYEETRDHDLAEHLIETARKGRGGVTLSDMARCIAWFCKAKKKWELAHRQQIFRDEMLGYQSLAKDFTPKVAEGAGIIPSENEDKLKADMAKGFLADDWTRFQRGWKGLQKMVFTDQHSSLENYRYYLYEYLYDFAEERLPDTHPVWGVVNVVNARLAAGYGAGYHELNAIADAIAGEPYERGLTPEADRKRLLKRPTPAIPLIHWPPIPLYANDNHTWDGKALMRRFRHELEPGVVQENLDFRYCGAYFGVCYRMVCQAQFGSVDDIAWQDVKWPKDLYKIVRMLWY